MHDLTLGNNLDFSALGQAAPNLAAIAKGRAAAANIYSMIEPKNGTPKELPAEHALVLPQVAGQIEFCNISFSYPARPGTIFENLSFSIGAGQTVAVVGPSGSGKSTVISLVQRFYDPNSGQVVLDGHDIKSLSLKWLREQMGLVSQEPALFATTIAGNILFGKPDADIDQIVEAAKAANAHTFIEKLPAGYETQVRIGHYWPLQPPEPRDVFPFRLIQDFYDLGGRSRNSTIRRTEAENCDCKSRSPEP